MNHKKKFNHLSADQCTSESHVVQYGRFFDSQQENQHDSA